MKPEIDVPELVQLARLLVVSTSHAIGAVDTGVEERAGAVAGGGVSVGAGAAGAGVAVTVKAGTGVDTVTGVGVGITEGVGVPSIWVQARSDISTMATVKGRRGTVRIGQS